MKELSYCQQRAILVAACDDISLSAYRATSDGALSELGRVKLSGKLVSCDFIAPAVLVSATGDSSLKIWDLQKQEHHLIQGRELIRRFPTISHAFVETFCKLEHFCSLFSDVSGKYLFQRIQVSHISSGILVDVLGIFNALKLMKGS